ncbi:DUF3263 domain-containing protein [Corynebacterium sp. 153RC1]|uniref:DUF3263 domain-containing protein n=1 Tax=Corynebacterium TaxID=1716 RepID=UPI00211BD04B|nr:MULTISPECIES: DUF3263 domain-containing protein [unclassified Corynebacterium]MCQ9370978.1 DUF3263 domain-containing protein [Corynebacterium sp. 35RC1]MCQ9343719.1 DUF3263 domain-containing protein [Corynebacterium sp. 76QC2CO]MCQ9352514.1 DUF3263 domain-containing protein [Corynebacterium sp. 209RC1]MCQ9354698.1 DUF3263 domain-containing protein [Corynebacterium sp. 1222RC1]MCQ9356809.1 DUF3263 domain-containing protein [Corynebacterium sp. 122RC1]
MDSDKLLDLLAFEEQTHRNKEEAIRERFGVSPVRYYQALNIAIDVPHVMAAYPLLTARLRRLRDARMNKRD